MRRADGVWGRAGIRQTPKLCSARVRPVTEVFRTAGMGFLMAVLNLHTPAALAAEVPGMLHWSRRVELGTPVSGVVARVATQPGQRVARGQLLVQLDDRRWRAELAKAQADVERLARVRDEAKREQQRAQELYDRNLISSHELETEKIALANAESEYQGARAARSQARLNVEYSALKTPFDALVLDVRAETGQSVVNELGVVPLVVVAEAGRMVVKASVEERALDGLAPGREVPVSIGGRRYQGIVTRVGLEPARDDGGALRYPIEVGISPPGEGLRAGQNAMVTLP